jgi:hypothetical protein
LGGNKPVTEVPIKNKSVTVKIIGIQDAAKLGQIKPDFKTLVTACNKAKKKSGKGLVFGAGVTDGAIGAHVQKTVGPPELVYLYLRTLCGVAKIIVDHSLSINDDNELVKMLNAHGLLCSPDKEEYRKYQCKKRTFDDGTGNAYVFNVHLKPSTYAFRSSSAASSMTVRIYLKWDDSGKVMRIGWIGAHPAACGDCPETACPGFKGIEWQIFP